MSVSDLRSRQKLRSASTAALAVPVTRHSTLGDRAFLVIAAKLWNALPGDIRERLFVSDTFTQLQ